MQHSVDRRLLAARSAGVVLGAACPLFGLQSAAAAEAAAAAFRTDGTPQGPELRVNTVVQNSQYTPAIAMNRRGDYVITWSGAGFETQGSDVSAQRYFRDGTPLGWEIPVNAHRPGRQYHPAVGMADDGSFVVGWMGDGAEGLVQSIFVQRFSAFGKPRGAAIRIPPLLGERQYLGALAVDAQGNFVVTWYGAWPKGEGPDVEHGVFAQRFGAHGMPSARAFRVDAGGVGEKLFSRVAAGGDGGFVITWLCREEGYNASVHARHYAADGRPLGNPLRLSEANVTLRGAPSVSVSARAAAAVVWPQRTRQNGSSIAITHLPLGGRRTALPPRMPKAALSTPASASGLPREAWASP